MTPKEKAEELVDKYRDTIMSFLSDSMKDMNAKKCALIAVDELHRIAPWSLENDIKEDSKQYWQEVKQEIEKL